MNQTNKRQDDPSAGATRTMQVDLALVTLVALTVLMLVGTASSLGTF